MATSLPTQTFASWQQRGLAFFRTSLKLPLGLKSFLGKTARAATMLVWSLQKSIETLDVDIVPQPQTSLATLQAWAFLLGLPNGGGGYGPLLPTTASGGQALLTGALGTTFPDGTQAVAEDGTTIVKVSGTVSIGGTPPGSGSVTAAIVAVTAGSIGNLAVGTVCTWQSPPSGADSTFKITSALSAGEDNETAAQIYARLLSRLQRPPSGGNSEDYTTWAEEIAGIVGVFIYPRRSGTGTIDVVITVGGSGTARKPSSTLVSSVQTLINSVRPTGCDAVTVQAPFTANAGHLVRVRVAPSANAPFDWGSDSPGTAYTVDTSGYAAGPPPTLQLTGLAPASLTNAITNYKNNLGPAPRLQILSTGGAAVNPPITAVDFTTVGGTKTKLTLGSIPTGWTAPSDGDTVYPYGSLVAIIAPQVLALADGLGPSRQSGYGDVYLTWQDTLSLNQIVRVVEDAADTTGTPLVTEVLSGGATIDGATSDVFGTDATWNAPELLYLSHVAITP